MFHGRSVCDCGLTGNRVGHPHVNFTVASSNITSPNSPDLTPPHLAFLYLLPCNATSLVITSLRPTAFHAMPLDLTSTYHTSLDIVCAAPPRFLSFRIASCHFTPPRRTPPHIVPPRFMSRRFTLPHVASMHVTPTSFYFNSRDITSPHFLSSHFRLTLCLSSPHLFTYLMSTHHATSFHLIYLAAFHPASLRFTLCHMTSPHPTPPATPIHHPTAPTHPPSCPHALVPLRPSPRHETQGCNDDGQCDVPEADGGASYSVTGDLLLQLLVDGRPSASSLLRCCLAGCRSGWSRIGAAVGCVCVGNRRRSSLSTGVGKVHTSHAVRWLRSSCS